MQQSTNTIPWHRIEHNVVKKYNDCKDGSIIITFTLLYCRLHGAFLTWIRDLFKNNICAKLLTTILCTPEKDISHKQFADQLNQNTTALKIIAYQLYYDDGVHHNNLQNVFNQSSKRLRVK